MSWKNVFLVLIGLRMLCWGSILYEVIEILVSIYKYPPLDPEINQITLIAIIMSAILMFLILLDVLVIYGLKKEKRFYSRLFLLIVGFISLIASTVSIVFVIYRYLNNPYTYGFNRDHLALLLILLTSTASIVIVFAEKIGKRKKSDQLAVPIDTINAEQEG